MPAGTYVIGSINFDLPNTCIESGEILAFLARSFVLLDGNNAPAPVQINSAFGAPLSEAPPVPEPGTAALLAFGTLGLAIAGRRRR